MAEVDVPAPGGQFAGATTDRGRTPGGRFNGDGISGFVAQVLDASILWIGVNPPSADQYVLWINTEDGRWYGKWNDGDSVQWVDLSLPFGEGLPGPRGPQGERGLTGQIGQGIPAGGTADQILLKVDGTDYNTYWGARPDDGLSVLNGAGVPSDIDDGVDGEFYIDTSAWDIYGPKTAGAWGTGTSLIGPTGAAGADGADGADGQGVPIGGSTGQVLAKVDGTDFNTQWVDRLATVVEDTTPQLGGDLDVNGNSIVSVSNGDINITPNGTGSVVLDGLSWPQSDGTADQVLKTDGAGALSWTDQTGSGSVPAQDDGVEIVATPTAFNFTGAGVTVTDVSGVATINIPGGGSGGGGSALGDWTDVLASRSVGTTYQASTTNRHVAIGGVRDNSVARILQVSEDQVTWIDMARSNTAGGGSNMYVVVPANWYYRIDPSGSPTIESWSEADEVSGSGGGSVPVQDDGVEIVATPTALNFTGDGVTVTDVSGVATVSITGGGGSSSSSSSGGGEVSARYWRISRMGPQAAVSFAEIEFRETIGGTKLVGTVSASSEFSGSYPAANANDGDPATLWASVSGGVHWFKIDLGSGNRATVRQVMVQSRSGSFSNQTPLDWTLEYSPDGNIWVEVAAVSDTGGNFTSNEIRTYDLTSVYDIGGGGVSFVRSSVPVVNGDFETGDGTGWTVDVGTISVVAFASTGWDDPSIATASENGTYILTGGPSQALLTIHQDIDISSNNNVFFYEGYLDFLKDFSDSDVAHITLQLLDSGGNVLSENSATDSSLTAGKRAGYVMVPVIGNPATLRIVLDLDRGSGTANNCGVDNITIQKVVLQVTTSDDEAPRTLPRKGDFSIDLNSGLAGSTDGTYGLYMEGAADASLLRGLLNSAGGADFTAICKVAVHSIPNYSGAGILVRDNTGKYTFCGPFGVNNGGYIEYSTWSDQTSFFSGLNGRGLGTTDIWVKVFYDHSAGTLLVSTSADGEIWHDFDTTNSHLGANVDAVGIGIQNRNGSISTGAWFKHWEVT